MTQPALPRPVVPSTAATLVILRDRTSAEVEALLLQRHAKSKFAAGDYVFAGGKIEADDMPPDGEGFCRGLTAAQAAARLGGGLAPRDALACWVGAIREAFEEVGVLLAYEAGGSLLRIRPAVRLRYEAYREACQKSNPAFFDMLRAEKLTLATDRLAYFAHWITPEEQPLRFDTRFFAAVMPPQDPMVDGHEIVALRWLTPDEAMEAFKRKDITLRLPTIKNLELVQSGGTRADEILGALRGRPVPTIRA